MGFSEEGFHFTYNFEILTFFKLNSCTSVTDSSCSLSWMDWNSRIRS